MNLRIITSFCSSVSPANNFLNRSSVKVFSENSFDSITAVTDEELALYSLAGLVLPKPGVVLVKIQSDPRVYSLEENSEDAFSPLLREIPDEPTAVSLYGANWAEYVIDIEPTFFAKFSQGDAMNSSETVDTDIMKKREELQ